MSAKKMVVTVTDYDLLVSVVNDACIAANERAADANANDRENSTGLEQLAEALGNLRKEVDQAYQFR